MTKWLIAIAANHLDETRKSPHGGNGWETAQGIVIWPTLKSLAAVD
jgi:hypothetical protein